MGVLLGFLVGWTVGARGGTKGYSEVVAAGKEVLQSQEFRALLGILRSHTEFTLRQLADWLGEDRAPGDLGEDVLARVRRLVTADGPSED